jgi:hypothetical protein
MPQVEGETTIPRWMFFTGAAAVVVGIGAIIWFAIPDIDTRHRLVSPSGQVALDIGEDCREDACARVIIRDLMVDGDRSRVACAVPLTEQRPMLAKVEASWSADETAVEIAYTDGDGAGGTFTLNLETDCTAAA